MTLISIPVIGIIVILVTLGLISGLYFFMKQPYKGSDDQDYYDIT